MARGSGPPVLLLHGFTQDSRVWRPQLEALSDDFTVVAWDAPGAGASFDPPSPFGFSDWARCLDHFMDVLGIERASLVGLSWGGVLAQELYRERPDRVRALVLADTYAGWAGSLPPPQPADRLAACIRDAVLPADEFVARYLPGMFSASAAPEVREELAAIMRSFHPAGFRLMAAALAHADTRDLLPTISVPTLLVWGEDDARSPLRVGQQLRNAIPGAELVTIPGAGHVSNLERPDEFSDAVRRFLRAAGGDRR